MTRLFTRIRDALAAPAKARRASAPELVPEWVVPVKQPVLWLFQPPRSGGTMFLRLFDGHPQVHVHPAPMNFRWPLRPDLTDVEKKFSLARFNRAGFYKHASNRPQHAVPIYFDERWFRAILARAPKRTRREIFDAAHTARFNAWRNYQNLYGPKRYVLVHSTIWQRTPVDASLRRFFDAYADGFAIFIARCPEDWLASGAKLEGSALSNMAAALDEYVGGCEAYLQARQNNPAQRMIVLEFNELVRDPHAVLSRLCERVGLDYHPALEVTTVNGTPVSANSAHGGSAKFAPDPSLIGRGAEIREAARQLAKFDAANRLFEALRATLG